MRGQFRVTVGLLNLLGVIARLDRAIQYAAAYRLNNDCLWNTGSPGPCAQLRTGRAMTAVRQSFTPSQPRCFFFFFPDAALVGHVVTPTAAPE